MGPPADEMRRYRACNVQDSDSDNEYFDSHGPEFWEEAADLAHSLSNSPVKGVPDTPLNRAGRIRDALSGLKLRSDLENISPPPSPTKVRTQSVNNSALREIKQGKLPVRQEELSTSEEEFEEVSESLILTDIEMPSPTLTKVSDFPSRTGSLSSLEFNGSSSRTAKFTSRKRQQSPIKIPYSPKMRKTSGGRVLVPDAAQVSSPLQGENDMIDEDDVFGPSTATSISRPTHPTGSKSNILFRPPLAQPDTPRGSGSTQSSATLLNPSKIAIDGLAPTRSSRPTVFDGAFGQALDSFVVAHCKETQRLMDSEEIAWGVQYLLAYGVTRGIWGWSDVRTKLRSLKGSNEAVAYRVHSVMLGKPLPPSPDFSVWREYDREQAAILENQQRGLGLMGEWHGEPDWYGGRIQQIARLVKPKDGPYAVYLDLPEKRRSHRIARFVGSRRVLQLRIPDTLLREAEGVREFCAQKFILCGRVFVPFHAKDNGLYMVETDEDWERRSRSSFGDRHRLSFTQFISWHNPPAYNQNQAISKWSTRWAIGLSNSMPAIEFDAKNIHYVEDEYADGCGVIDGKVPDAAQIMTDGCGFINQAALLVITRKFYDSRPTAVQGRIAGAKGLWTVDPEDRSDEPKIWIRRSQNKVLLPDLAHRSHRIFDLLSAAHPSASSQLTFQSILNVAHNGVPAGTLKVLLVDALEEEVQPLLRWDARAALWAAVEKAGGVAGMRIQRYARGSSRVLGISGRDYNEGVVDEDGVDDGEPDAVVEADAYSGRNAYSGAPWMLHESVVELLQAGFHPARSQLLWTKLQSVVKLSIESSVSKFRIPITESLEALVIPDPLGILNEGEIYYHSSKGIKDPVTETYFNTLVRTVVVGRYPMRLPSDMQKMEAVDYPDLQGWSDVVVMSTKGSYSPMSILSGGDCDGDILLVVWEASIVEPFKNKSLVPEPPNFHADNFARERESVADFGRRMGALPSAEAQRQFQDVLLLGLVDRKVGMYSHFHDMSVLSNGYDHAETVRLSYMFNTLLDSSKTGYRLKPEIFSKDSRKYNRAPPDYMPGSKTDDGRVMLQRRRDLGTFIIQTLVDAGRVRSNEILCRFDQITKPLKDGEPADMVLTRPYTLAFKTAAKYDIYKRDLCLIEAHVLKAKEAWYRANRESSRESASPQKPSSKKAKPRSGPPVAPKNDLYVAAAREFAEPVAGVELIGNVDEVKAAYAYHVGPVSFAFSVAFRGLCVIKAGATRDGLAPVTRMFDEVKSISAAALRAIGRADETE